MRRWGTLVAVGLTLSGCKYLDRANRGDRPPGDDRGLISPTGRKNRDRDRDAPPPASIPKPDQHWLDDPSGKTGRTELPSPTPTGRRNSPTSKDSGNDGRTAGQGILAGYVVDQYGKKLRGVLIDVSPADRAGPGAPTSVETGDDGSFQIEGLQTGQTYDLSARTTREGVKVAGQLFATPPNARVRLTLREGVTLPDDGAGSRNPGHAPPKSSLPAPVPLSGDGSTPASPTDAGRSDGSWSPTGPPPTPGSDPVKPANPPRPELTTEGPTAYPRPPVTTIPPPTSIPTPAPGPTFPPLPADPSRRESRSVRPKSEFVLVDTLGRPKDFPSGRAGELVLVEFVTTGCKYGTDVVPALKALQSRYGASGLDLIGVVCDEVDTPQRRAVAANYQRSNDLNYLLYVEPGARPGKVRDRFGADTNPALVLLAPNGDVLWKGDPSALGQLERVLNEQLGK